MSSRNNIPGMEGIDFNTPVDLDDVDKEKLADAFNMIREQVSIDDRILDARRKMKSFNEYVSDEKNNIHHIEICDGLDSWEDIASIVPRNGAKSTIVSCRYPAYRLGQDKGLRIILASHTEGLASSFTRSCEAIMRTDKYRLLFGDLIPSPSTVAWSSSIKWNETEKIVANRPEFNSLGFRVDAKDASMFAIGVGGAIVGRRSDIIILDDIIDRDNVKTEAQLQNIKYWFNEELRGTRHAKTQTIVVGSRWSARDIYIDIISTMLKNGAEILGNMVEEVLEQVRQFRELEKEIEV